MDIIETNRLDNTLLNIHVSPWIIWTKGNLFLTVSGKLTQLSNPTHFAKFSRNGKYLPLPYPKSKKCILFRLSIFLISSI